MSDHNEVARNHDRIIGAVIGGRPFGAEKNIRKTLVGLPSPTLFPFTTTFTMAAVQVVNVQLPALSSGWSAEKDFKPVGALSGATQRNLEPVGPHFLAHARRVNDSRCPATK